MVALKLSLDEYQVDDRVLFQKQELSFPGNGLYLLEGKNGSGKTTLLSFLTGQKKGACLTYYGKVIASKEKAYFFDNYVSYLPQDPLVFYDKSIIDNILFPYEKKDISKAESLLFDLGLSGCKDEKVSSLSYGEKQRLAFARMLYQPKRILLFDEIDSGLDKESSSIIKRKIEELKKEHIIILSTHSEYDENDNFVYQIENGSVKVKKEGMLYPSKSSEIKENQHFFDYKRTLKENRLFYLVLSFAILILNVAFMTFGSVVSIYGDKVKQQELAFNNIQEKSNSFFIKEEAYQKIKKNLIAEEAFPLYDYTTLSFDHDLSKAGSCLSGYVGSDDFSFLTLKEGRFPQNKNEVLISGLSYQNLQEKKNISLDDKIPTQSALYSNLTIVGTYQAKESKLIPSYLRALTSDGESASVCRLMYLFMVETMFCYEKGDRSNTYIVLNDIHTKEFIQASMVDYLSMMSKFILLGSDLKPLYRNNQITAIGNIVFLSLLIEVLFTFYLSYFVIKIAKNTFMNAWVVG